MGDANHQGGVVLAEIVKANIPVRNGVVHLIQRPLMVVDSTVKDFLEVSVRSIRSQFDPRAIVQSYRLMQSCLIHSAATASRISEAHWRSNENVEITNSLVRDITLILSIYFMESFLD